MSLNSSTEPLACAKCTWLDRLGVGVALICTVHCLLTPILVVLFVIVASSFGLTKTFILGCFMVIPLTVISFYMGCRKHHDIFLVILAVFSIGCSFSTVIFVCSTIPNGHSIFQIQFFGISLMSLSQFAYTLVVVCCICPYPQLPSLQKNRL